MKNKLSHILKKIGISILAAIAFKLLFFRLPEFLEPDLFVIPFIVLILWEGNIFIDKQLEKKYSWLSNANQRKVLVCCANAVFASQGLLARRLAS